MAYRFESGHRHQKKGLLNNPKEKVQTLSEIGQGLLFLAHQGCG